MKRSHFFSILFIVYFLYPFSGFSQKLSIDDLIERGGIYYEVFDDNPFNGRVEGILNGQIINGKWEGVWTHFYKNGPLGSKIYYKKGKKDGSFETYHDNGQLLSRGTYVNGVLNGIMEIFDIRGQLKAQRFFKQGIQSYQR